MNVHTGTGLAHYRLWHKGGVQIMHLGYLLCAIFQREHLVRYIQTRPIMEIYFILAETNLMVRRFNFDSEILQCTYYLFYDLVSFMRRKVEIAAVIYRRSSFFTVNSEQIEFRLRPDIINKACLCRFGSCLFKDKPRVAFKRFSI